LKLQKLVYYAQAWSLALLRDKLFEEDFEAWAHGPVSPSIYRAYAGAGWNPLCAEPERSAAIFREDQEELLEQVAEAYGAYSAKRLEAMTHSEAPWQSARGGLAPEARSQAKISKSEMAQFYKDLFDRADEEASTEA